MKIAYNLKNVKRKTALVLFAYFSKTWVTSGIKCCNLLFWTLPSSELSPLSVVTAYRIIASLPMLTINAQLLNLVDLLLLSIIPQHSFLPSPCDFQSSPAHVRLQPLCLK